MLRHRLPADATELLIAVPQRTFEEFVRENGGLKGFEVVKDPKLPPVERHRANHSLKR